MKVLITYGSHANETAATRLCFDWNHTKKDRVYTEVTKLAYGGNRQITDNELILVDVHKYTAHWIIRNFVKKYPLKRLLKVYEGHIERVSEEYRPLLREYLDHWKNVNVSKIKEVKKLMEGLDALSRKYRGYFKTAGAIDFIFPRELDDFVKNPNQIWSPQFFEEIPMVTEKLAPGDLLIDLHCEPKEENKAPYIEYDIYIDKQVPPEGKVELIKLLSKYGHDKNNYSDNIRELDSGYNNRFSCILVEIPAPYVKRKITEFYERTGDCLALHTFCYRYPNITFIEFLTIVFNSAVYEKSDAGVFSDLNMYPNLYNHGYFVDPAFYKTKDFHEAKRFVAKIIREVFEWGEKYENKAN